MTVKEQFQRLKSTLGFSDFEELQSELDNYLQEKMMIIHEQIPLEKVDFQKV